MSQNAKLSLAVLSIIALLGGFACGALLIVGSKLLPWGQIAEALRSNAPTAGRLAPDFELNDLQERPIRLSELRGKPVMLNFWATWCGPCALEMPIFQHYSEQYPDLVIVAVNANEPVATVKEFAGKWGLTFQILLDSEDKVSQQYNVFALPTTYFLDAEGQIKAVHTGSLNDSQLEKYLKQIGVME